MDLAHCMARSGWDKRFHRTRRGRRVAGGPTACVFNHSRRNARRERTQRAQLLVGFPELFGRLSEISTNRSGRGGHLHPFASNRASQDRFESGFGQVFDVFGGTGRVIARHFEKTSSGGDFEASCGCMASALAPSGSHEVVREFAQAATNQSSGTSQISRVRKGLKSYTRQTGASRLCCPVGQSRTGARIFDEKASAAKGTQHPYEFECEQIHVVSVPTAGTIILSEFLRYPAESFAIIEVMRGRYRSPRDSFHFQFLSRNNGLRIHSWLGSMMCMV